MGMLGVRGISWFEQVNIKMEDVSSIATVKSENWYRKKQIEQNIFTKIQENSRRQEKHKGGD